MIKLFLLRHIKSQWNTENRFTGWTDVPLDENETWMAQESAKKIFQFKIDKIYCSPLFRNEDTVVRVLRSAGKYPVFRHIDGGRMEKWGDYAEINKDYFPVFVTENLNERYYGKIQGENKESAKQKYGEEKVHLWRRSFDVAPPGGESLKDVIKRTNPFYQKYVEKDLKAGKNVLVVASHNTLRAIVKYVEKISDEEIINFEMPYGGLMGYEFDEALKLQKKELL